MNGQVSPSSVTVVIAALRHDKMLRAQLEALKDQSVSGFEVVVSINGTLGGPFEDFGVYSVDPLVRVVDGRARLGPSHARNVGWVAASGTDILFCDADDVVSPRWVESMIEGLARAALVGGQMDYSKLNNERDARWFGRGEGGLPIKFEHLEFAPASNLAIKRFVLEETGGFEENLRCGEDIDLCWRAAYGGHRIEYAPDAVVHYRLRSRLSATYRQAYRYGLSDADLLFLHAESGAIRSRRESLRDLLRVGRSVVYSPLRDEGLGHAAYRIGNLAGRTMGSLRRRVWAV